MIEITLRGVKYDIVDWSRFSDYSVGIPDHIDDAKLEDAEGKDPGIEWTDAEWEQIFDAINEYEREQYRAMMQDVEEEDDDGSFIPGIPGRRGTL